MLTTTFRRPHHPTHTFTLAHSSSSSLSCVVTCLQPERVDNTAPHSPDVSNLHVSTTQRDDNLSSVAHHPTKAELTPSDRLTPLSSHSPAHSLSLFLWSGPPFWPFWSNLTHSPPKLTPSLPLCHAIELFLSVCSFTLLVVYSFSLPPSLPLTRVHEC